MHFSSILGQCYVTIDETHLFSHKWMKLLVDQNHSKKGLIGWVEPNRLLCFTWIWMVDNSICMDYGPNQSTHFVQNKAFKLLFFICYIWYKKTLLTCWISWLVVKFHQCKWKWVKFNHPIIVSPFSNLAHRCGCNMWN
jgi:hypothetical protein